MKIFLIFNSNIKKLTKEDFAEYSQITQLWFSTCDIEYLPGNLLDLLPNLEIISIQSCKIKYIDANIFDNHPNLKVAKFNSNINIDCWYDSVSGNDGPGKVSFEEMKKKLKHALLQPMLPMSLAADLKAYLNDPDTKDYFIHFDGAPSIKVHSFILKSRSSKLKEMLDESEFRFDEYSKEDFEKVIECCYTEEIAGDYDVLKLLQIANDLEIPIVKKFAIENIDKVKLNKDNAFEVMKLSLEIGDKKLQRESFMEVKKSMPEVNFKYKWAGDVKKLEAIVKAKEIMEQKIEMAKKQAKEEFIKMIM